MTDDEFLAKLREAFAVEAGEHVQAMTTGLIELEKSSDPAARRALAETTFREAHSLKGAARAVSRGDIESVCQAIEGVFSAWRKSPPEVAPEAFDLLNRAVDLVSGLVKMPGPGKQGACSSIVRDLNALQENPPVAAPVPSFPETPSIPSPLPAAVRAPAAPPPPVSETVRIPMAKMDAVLRQAEELVMVKLTASQRTLDLRALSHEIAAWRKEWSRIRDATRSGLAGESPASLARVGDFLTWNESFMRAIDKRAAALERTAAQDERSLGARIDDLLEDARGLLMLPFATLLDVFPKLVRDLAREQGKEIELKASGRDVEIDKRILQEMKDPLIHLVRNSIDHGLEKPGVRETAGKPRAGTLTLAVSQRGAGKVEILVRDDGQGIDAERVKDAVVRSGGISEEEARALGRDEALELIFHSGVSTSPIVTEISGRGLGMAIVREKTAQLSGQISVETQPGRGTTFRIVLPVTVATFKGILVQAGGQEFVIPTASVERVARIGRAEIGMIENKETFVLNRRRLALARLDEVLELPPRQAPRSPDELEVVVLGAGDERIGFSVDEILHESEVLVKPLGKPLIRVRNIAGATVLGSGAPALILHAPDLLKSAVRLAGPARGSRAAPRAPEEAASVSRILVADDSITSRMLLKNILESAGYAVTTAVDGLDALTALKAGDFDLLVSDVEMPRLDGFELTQKVRAEAALAELPVVLVTALGSPEHRERGIDAGANGYIVKGSFDQSNLLEVIGKLI